MSVCECKIPKPANGNLTTKLCTACGLEIRVNLEDRINGLEKDLEIECKSSRTVITTIGILLEIVEKQRIDIANHKEQIDVLNSNMAKATDAIEHLITITKMNKDLQTRWTQQQMDENINKIETIFCSCQQLASTEVNGKHICVGCYRIVEESRIKNEKEVDEACRTVNKENSNINNQDSTTMPEIIQPQNQVEAEKMYQIRPGVYVKGGSCEGGSCDG